MRHSSVSAALICVLLGCLAIPAPAQVPARYRPHIKKGLEWLAKAQDPRSGKWEGSNGQYPVAMTALAGMALLAEGSTAQQGKYAKNIAKARDYLMSQSMANGLISNPGEMHA